MNKICYGCGVKLQCINKDEKGYIPESKMEDAKYCMRCFRMMNYGEHNETETPKDAKEIVNKINKDNRFVIFLVDFLNINDEVISIFKSIKKKKVLVINKCELLPSSVSQFRIADYLVDYYHIRDEIKFKGGKNNRGAKSILNYLEKNNINESYILGISNSGKSTLINDLIKLCDSKVAKINASKKANTTLDFIRVKLNDNLTLIDSPGVILKSAIRHDVDNGDIKAYSINMEDNQTVGLIDNQYYFNIASKTPIVFYSNIENNKTVKKYFKDDITFINEFKVSDNTDIVIKGIGLITIKKSTTIKTTVDKKYIEIRPSMFTGVKNED